MQIDKNNVFSIIFLTLMLTSAFLLLPTSSAHTPPMTIPTYAYLSVQPSPIGIGQDLFVNFWLDKPPPTANGVYGDRWGNFTVTVTKPDGTISTLGPFKSDAVGGSYTTIRPDQVGVWSFVFNFQGQIAATGAIPPNGVITNKQSVGDYFTASTSRTVTVSVTSDSIQNTADNPLPTGYWERPIFGENNNWYSIAGNWLGGGPGGNSGGTYNSTSNFAPYTTAPSTSHIVWSSSYALGGIIGGEFGGGMVNSNFYSTAQYENKFTGIIIDGILYYTKEPGASTNYAGWVAQDLRTGEVLWTKDTAAWLRMGQIFDYTSPNQFGGIAYLWSVEKTTAPNTGSTYGMYDAMTGKYILSIVNASNPTWAYGPTGELLGYYLDTSTWTINMWNSTRAILAGASGTGDQNNWLWRPAQDASIAWKYGVQWSEPIATTMTASNGSTVNINAVYAESCGVANNLVLSKVADILLITNIPGFATSFTQPGYFIAEAYSTTTGHLLWGPQNITVTPYCRVEVSSIGAGVFTVLTYETQSYSAYSTASGYKLWGPVSVQQPNVPWGYYITNSIIAYGNLYTADFGGYVTCLDLSNGNIKWTWNTGSSGYETPYGVYTLPNMLAIAGGEVFVMGGHLYSPPLFHGGEVYAINATSGQLVWSSPSFAITNRGTMAIADGYAVIPNAYDNRIYCFNKGRSETNINIQNDVVSLGNQVMVKGTVTDQSPGETCLGIPTAGTPAIADEYMDQWMQYLYMQQPMPTNATGVTVTLTVVDPNNNTYTIGTTASDIDGIYGLAWTPEVPGTYKVTATFCGSGSYYSSHATTMFVVSPQSSPEAVATPTPTVEPTATPVETASPTVAPQPDNGVPAETLLIAAAAVVIVVAVIVAALVLRKRQ